MGKYSQGRFIPKNPQKLVGKSEVTFRSSWELTVMNFLDNHPNVIQWASESISIPYINPLTGQPRKYIPDFMVLYQDKNGRRRAEVIEVKPSKEALLEKAKSQRDKAVILMNTAKWAAAMTWCKQNGMTFRVLTESDIYVTKPKGKRR
jgi:TnsA endonuclease N terminal